MGKEDKLQRLEDRQEDANPGKYWRLQRRQERIAKRHGLEDVFKDIDTHPNTIKGIEYLQSEIGTERELLSLKLEGLKVRIKDIRKQLRKLEPRLYNTKRYKLLNSAEARLRYLQKTYLDTNIRYNKQLDKGRFREDMRDYEKIEKRIEKIVQEIEKAKDMGGGALTDPDMFPATRSIKNKDSKEKSSKNKKGTGKDTETQSDTTENKGDTAYTMWRDSIIHSENITNKGKSEALGATEILNKGLKIGSLIAGAVGIYQLIFQHKKEGAKLHHGRKTIAGGAAVRGLQRGLNSRKRGSEEDVEQAQEDSQEQQEQAQEDQEASEQLNTNKDKILQAFGSSPLSLIGQFLVYKSDNKTLSHVDRDNAIQAFKNMSSPPDRYERIKTLEYLRDNEGDETFKLLVEQRKMDKDYIDNHPTQQLTGLYFSLPEEQRVLTDQSPESSPNDGDQENEKEISLNQHIESASKEQDRRGYHQKLETLNITQTEKIEAMKTLMGLSTKYPGSGLNIIPTTDNNGVYLTTTRGVTQKINLTDKTIEGFESKSTGAISFPSTKQTLLAGRKSIVLVNLAKKLTENKPTKSPFKMGGRLEGSGVDLENKKTARETFKEQLDRKPNRGEFGRGMLGGTAGSVFGKALLGSFMARPGWVAGVGVGLGAKGRKARNATKDMLDDIDDKTGQINDIPILNNYTDQYISYLNKLYDKNTIYNTELENAEQQYALESVITWNPKEFSKFLEDVSILDEKEDKEFLDKLFENTTNGLSELTTHMTLSQMKRTIQNKVEYFNTSNNKLTIKMKDKSKIEISFEKLFNDHMLPRKAERLKVIQDNRNTMTLGVVHPKDDEKIRKVVKEKKDTWMKLYFDELFGTDLGITKNIT